MSFFARDYDYALPPELIAQRPLPERAASRMMLLHRAEQRIEHAAFADFPSFIRAGDLVVLNDTKVVPARAFTDDGKNELLFLEAAGVNAWRCMVKPGRRMRVGNIFTLGQIEGRVLETTPAGERIIEFAQPLDLEKIGRMPIPPYLARESDAGDAERYQTVYARAAGAVAAPTAGLHFTPEILARVPHEFITLHVGTGTFRSVKTDDIREHEMHSERFAITAAAAARINAATRAVAIGTTTTRVLESCVRSDGEVREQEGATDIFIHPPFEFRRVGALLTNFHLPKSTLLMLVCAMAGRDFIMEAYAAAIRERYRFFSYGDCMLIL